MTNYPFTSSEMKALAGVVHMECTDANKEATKLRKNGLMTTVSSQKQIIDCWEDTYVKANDSCGEEYKALVACLYNNERRSLKCLKLRNALEECYVRKVVLKQSS
eukprot:CAMPEP_0119012518 /NCGR_PEP_ID=MMETSP1176-20130426/6855_1 /TAXON_ID=265551 /ORGANISM="Synedropsis recta cf, Strain CCMP1620" /LENGTH=104 /DNA_ID=CAMNT_0006965497 /DNA_START=78 /DNA_END=392 /DNA_ORIENTATION=+